MTEENGQQIDATVEHVVPDSLAVAYRKALEALQGAWERQQPDSGLLASDDYMTAQAALGMLETLLTTRADVSADIRPQSDPCATHACRQRDSLSLWRPLQNPCGKEIIPSPVKGEGRGEGESSQLRWVGARYIVPLRVCGPKK
ncbi:MAG: hypothetical protein OXE05_12445 [Chloroflexi bacterium]|nr:hypothetical protein [Chloroflexota bacterium]